MKVSSGFLVVCLYSQRQEAPRVCVPIAARCPALGLPLSLSVHVTVRRWPRLPAVLAFLPLSPVRQGAATVPSGRVLPRVVLFVACSLLPRLIWNVSFHRSAGSARAAGAPGITGALLASSVQHRYPAPALQHPYPHPCAGLDLKPQIEVMFTMSTERSQRSERGQGQQAVSLMLCQMARGLPGDQQIC